MKPKHLTLCVECYTELPFHIILSEGCGGHSGQVGARGGWLRPRRLVGAGEAGWCRRAGAGDVLWQRNMAGGLIP